MIEVDLGAPQYPIGPVIERIGAIGEHYSSGRLYPNVHRRDLLFAFAQQSTERNARQHDGVPQLDFITPLAEIARTGVLDPLNPVEDLPPPIEPSYWRKLSKGNNHLVDNPHEAHFSAARGRLRSEINTQDMDPDIRGILDISQTILNVHSCIDDVLTDVDTANDARFRYPRDSPEKYPAPVPIVERQSHVAAYMNRLVNGYIDHNEVQTPGFADIIQQLPFLHTDRYSQLMGIYGDGDTVERVRNMIVGLLTLKISERREDMLLRDLRAPVIQAIGSKDPDRMFSALDHLYALNPELFTDVLLDNMTK